MVDEYDGEEEVTAVKFQGIYLDKGFIWKLHISLVFAVNLREVCKLSGFCSPQVLLMA